jgi:twinkle protein
VLNQAVIALDQDDADIVLIDPWNELERAKPPSMLMTDYIGQCLMYLKQFCRATQATVIMVAHPTKAGIAEGKTPALADIEGSMNWYNKCDNGLIVARDPEANTCKVISAKAREIGSGKRGMCWFHVDKDTGIFTPQHGAVT